MIFCRTVPDLFIFYMLLYYFGVSGNTLCFPLFAAWKKNIRNRKNISWCDTGEPVSSIGRCAKTFLYGLSVSMRQVRKRADPSVQKTKMALCFAMTASAMVLLSGHSPSVKIPSQAMGAADCRDPTGGEIPVQCSQALFPFSPSERCSFLPREVVSGIWAITIHLVSE